MDQPLKVLFVLIKHDPFRLIIDPQVLHHSQQSLLFVENHPDLVLHFFYRPRF